MIRRLDIIGHRLDIVRQELHTLNFGRLES
jgi:hypothetical protein